MFSFQSQTPPPKSATGSKTEEEIKEEEELQLALALSQSEAEEAEKQRKKRGGGGFYGVKQEQQQQQPARAPEQKVCVKRKMLNCTPKFDFLDGLFRTTYYRRLRFDECCPAFILSLSFQPLTEEEVSPELMRYLNRDYWEQKEKEKVSDHQPAQLPADHQPQPVSAPVLPHAGAFAPDTAQMTMAPAAAASGVNDMAGGAGKSAEELDEFVTTLRTQVR
jgi:growth factor-regulated tyrosine kinase substrate